MQKITYIFNNKYIIYYSYYFFIIFERAHLSQWVKYLLVPWVWDRWLRHCGTQHVRTQDGFRSSPSLVSGLQSCWCNYFHFCSPSHCGATTGCQPDAPADCGREQMYSGKALLYNIRTFSKYFQNLFRLFFTTHPTFPPIRILSKVWICWTHLIHMGAYLSIYILYWESRKL